MSRAGGYQRTAEQKERDLALIARLYLQGRAQPEIAAQVAGLWQDDIVKAALAAHQPSGKLSQAEIAELVGLSQQQVSMDLRELHERWLASSRQDTELVKAEMLAKIDAIEREAWDAWFASKEEVIKTTQYMEPDPKKPEIPKPVRGTTTKEQRLADTKYMDIIKWCIEQRLKIHAVYGPTKVNIAGADGGPIRFERVEDLEELSDEALDLIIREGLAAKQAAVAGSQPEAAPVQQAKPQRARKAAPASNTQPATATPVQSAPPSGSEKPRRASKKSGANA